MPRKCTVCIHPKQANIDQALLDNAESHQAIADRYNLSRSAVSRHRSEHLSERLAAVAERNADADVRQAFDVITQLRQINEETMNVLRTARTDANHGLVLRAVDRVRRQIELQAKLIDLINDAPTINVTISPQWIELRTMIIAALEEYPEARQAVARALEANERNVSHEST